MNRIVGLSLLLVAIVGGAAYVVFRLPDVGTDVPWVMLDPPEQGSAQQSSTGAYRAERTAAPTRALEGSTPLDARARRIHAALAGGETAATCTAAVQSELQELLRDAEAHHDLWTWSFERALACRRANPDGASIAALLNYGLKAQGGNPRVLELVAAQNIHVGRPDLAVGPASDALRIRESYSAWEMLATAKLAMADNLAREGGDRAEIATQYRDAAEAAARAGSLASAGMRPFQTLKKAQATLGLGKSPEAVELAVQAEKELALADSANQATLQADFYMQLGYFYYRAGQRELGIAFMDQALRTASGDSLARLQALKAGFLSSSS